MTPHRLPRAGWLALVLPAAIAAAACGDSGDAESGASMSEAGESTSTGATTSTTGASASASSGSGASASSSTTATSSTTDATGSATSTEGGPETGADESSGSGGGPLCEPAPGDDPCVECIKAPCCEHYTNCENDEVCACTLDCVLTGSSLGSCKSRCNGDSELYEALFFCGQMFCLNTCEWECC